MSAMAAPAPAPVPRLDPVLSFSDADLQDPPETEPATPAFSDAGSDAGADADFEFEFAFAPPLSPSGDGAHALAPADDLFANGRIVPAYPLFDRHLLFSPDHEYDDDHHHHQQQQHASTAPPSPDTYCAWAPRSPSRDPTSAAAALPKSSSTGEARRFWRLRDLVSGGGGRSHSDGKEKFVFLQSGSNPAATTAKAAAAPPQKLKLKQKQEQEQRMKKKKAGDGKATEMDMATAHRLFYGKPGAAGAALAGDRPRQQQQQQSYLPYRPGIVGFFASAHALGRSHHPY